MWRPETTTKNGLHSRAFIGGRILKSQNRVRKKNTIMNTQDQRLVAAKLARQLGATKTLAVINDETKNSPIDVILKTADEEVGREKLMSVILESEFTFWALGALRYLSNLGDYESKLKVKAKLVFLPSAHNQEIFAAKDANINGSNLQSINTFQMYLACGMGYVANFTIYYFTPPFSNSWNKSTIFSGNKIPVCQSETKGCDFFSMTDCPLQPGDTVMMTVGVGGGPDAPTNIWFNYDPKAKYTAQIDCYGTTLMPSFTWSVKGN